jgi:hypothetical protein
MLDSLQPENVQRPNLRTPLVAAGAFAALLLVFFFLFSSGPGQPGAALALPFGPAEQAYAPAISHKTLSLSRAENMVHQEVILLSGEVTNGGSRGLAQVEVTIEFRDSLNQVVLRETRTLLSRMAGPLAPGQRRAFELSFEHLPRDWNMSAPVLRVSGLNFS